MGAPQGLRQSDPNRLQGRLSLKKPAPTNALLPSNEPFDNSLDAPETQGFALAIWNAKLAWERRRGFDSWHGDDNRIGRGEAERRLRRALAALAEKGDGR